jgi:dynein light chain Tctex-type 1
MSTTEETQPLTASAPPPVPFSRLREIANSVRNPTHAKRKLLTTFQACEAALSSASAYEHSSTESWNATIISTIIQALVKETSTPTTQPQYKFAINSIIIEHVPASSVTGIEKRGMHSAAAAYWNAEKDGMWNFKYEAAELKGLDVVVGIIWISI